MSMASKTTYRMTPTTRSKRPKLSIRSRAPAASAPAVRRRMRATPRRDTPCELALRSAVYRLGLRYRVDWPLPGTRRRADLAFPRLRIAVMVDGCFWHGCPVHAFWPKTNAAWWREKILGNVARDLDTDSKLKAAGWKVLRFWEHDDAAVAASAVARVAAGQRIRFLSLSAPRRCHRGRPSFHYSTLVGRA